MYAERGGSKRAGRPASRARRPARCLHGPPAACSPGTKINLGGGQSADPASTDYPIFYVKRTIPIDER